METKPFYLPLLEAISPLSAKNKLNPAFSILKSVICKIPEKYVTLTLKIYGKILFLFILLKYGKI